MESATAPAPSRASDPAVELIDLSDPENPFQRMKACSVVTYGEKTLQRLPWSGLHGREERGIESIDAPEERWTVTSRGPSLVGTYERSVFRALEWMAIDGSVAQGIPFVNPLIVHPRDICERLCWRATQPQFEAIERSMQDLCRVEIAGGTTRFGLLRSAIAGTQRTVNRSLTCPQFVVYFDRFFVDSVNAGRVRPINWSLWIALRDPAAQRLLEILDPEFVNRDGVVTASLDADLIARLLPLSPSASRHRRRTLLARAHSALLARGYLEKVDVRGDVYRYRPGPTWRAMQYHLQKRPPLPSRGRLLKTAD
jgi:hypothetical protein